MSESVLNSTNVGCDEGAVFKHARDHFFQRLSSKDREVFAQISTSTELLDDFKKLQATFKDGQRWTKIFSAVKACNDRLQPYFKIIEIITSSHPEWAAVAWGAFRLILQVASNFVGFFEKLADILSQVASLIPAYSDILQLDTSKASNRFRISLGKFYEDLLEFFQAVLHLFTQRSGKLKRTHIVISQLLWRPFEVRFKNFLERLEFHRKVLRLELEVLQFTAIESFSNAWRQEKAADSIFQAEARRHFELVEEMRRKFYVQERGKLISAAMVWINAPTYADVYEKSIAIREQGTAKWLIGNDAFKTWRHTRKDASNGVDSTRVLWVAGNPGSGKTVLAASCVQELRFTPQNLSSTSSSTAYFFFEAGRSGASKWNDVLRAILAQVLQQNLADSRILDFFATAMSSKRLEGQSTATCNVMIDLITSLIMHLGRVYLVLDGIDESDAPDDILLDLWKLRTISGLRIALFSRPNVGFLRRFMKPEQIINTKSDSQIIDIEVYVRRKLERLCDLGLLPSTAAIEQQVGKILLGADGMFLWATLMMAHLRSPAFSCSQRVSMIASLTNPEKLDQMYDRIFRLFARNPRYEQAFTRSVLLWLTFQRLPLKCSQLKDILWPQSAEWCHTNLQSPADDIEEFENSVIVLCGGLVEFQYTICHFTHHSAWEYIRSRCSANETAVGAQASSTEHFFPPSFVANTEHAASCLSYINSRAFAGPLSGSINQRASALLISTFMPFLNYAALAWPSHLLGTLSILRPTAGYSWPQFRENFEELLQLLSRFLHNKMVVMSWIETVYTYAERGFEGISTRIFSDMSAWAEKAEDLILQLAVQHKTSLPQTLAAFSKSMTSLLRQWNSTLSRQPNLIWAEVTAFTENPFLQRSSAFFTEILKNATSQYTNDGVEQLTRISRLHDVSGLCAVLTIFPSSHFRDRRLQIEPHASREILREFSLGWTAQFEVYNTRLQKARIEEEWKFDIDPDEVIQHIQNFSKMVTSDQTETANRSTRKDLALHFPISIGNNLEVFTVLRKVYIHTSFRDSSSSISNNAHQHWRVLSIPVEHSESSTLLPCFSKPFSEQANPEADVSTWKSASIKVDDLTAFRLVAHNEYILYYALRGTSVTRNSRVWRNIEEKEEKDDEDEDDDDYSIDTGDESPIFNQTDTVPEAEWMASSIAVFRVVGAEQKEEICLLDYLKNAGDDEYIVRCAFHPDLPLLVFHGVSKHIGRIVLWSFRSFECSRQGFEAIPRFETLIERNLRWTESLQFSPCGQQVIFEEYSAECPTIISVGENTLYRMAQELLPENRFESGADKVQSMSLAGEMTLSQNKMILHDAENSTRLDFHPNSIHSDLDLVKISDGFQIVQPLISLPKQPGIQHANISILPASDRNETMIRMVITKSPKLFCSLADADNDTPPVIVGKESQVLLLAKQRKLGSNSLRAWESLTPIMSVASGVSKTAYSMIQAPNGRLQLSEDESKNMKHKHTPMGMDKA